MIVFYGTKEREKILGNTPKQECRHCGEETQLKVVNHGEWFTLMFLPIFPTSRHYYLKCPLCGSYTNELDKEEALAAIAK